MPKPIKTEFVPAVNGAPDFTQQAEANVGLLPTLADYADDSNVYQEDIYGVLNGQSILPTPSGLVAENVYAPLRVSADGTALVAEQQANFDDGGETVKFKALYSNDMPLAGYRRQIASANGSPIVITARRSISGDVRFSAVFCGDLSVGTDDETFFTITHKRVTIAGTNTVVLAGITVSIRLDGETSTFDVNVENYSPHTIYVVNFTLLHNIPNNSLMSNLDIASFAPGEIAEAMSAENGYFSPTTGHANHLGSLSLATRVEEPIARPCTLTLKGIADGGNNELAFPASLFDAHIQTGSASNLYAG